MPFYEYECKNCGKRFEKMQSITADPLTECLLCGGGPIHRVLQPVGVIFKGSGWYVTDSKRSAASKSDSKSSSTKDESAPASEANGSDGKAGGEGSSETKSADSPAKSEASSKPSTPE